MARATRYFTLAAHFLGHFFDVVLHDYIMKLRSYTSYVGNVVYAHQKLVAYVSVRFFFFSFSAAHFHLAGC